MSFNRGEDWFLWRHGVPPAPVRSLVIHPRDHDLVIGTHGRAIYILDDIRALRALAENPEPPGSPCPPLRTPTGLSEKRVGGGRIPLRRATPCSGERTRAVGAMLHVWDRAGRIRRRSPPMEILDPDGEVIRSLEGPAEPGLNRVVWDLRETNPLWSNAGGGPVPTHGAGGASRKLRGQGQGGRGRVLQPDGGSTRTPEWRSPWRPDSEDGMRSRRGSPSSATLQDLQERLRSVHEGLGWVGWVAHGPPGSGCPSDSGPGRLRPCRNRRAI